MEKLTAQDLVEKMGCPQLLIGKDKFTGTMADLFGFRKTSIENNSMFSVKKFLLTAYRHDLSIYKMSDNRLEADDSSGQIFLLKRGDNWVFDWEPIPF